MVKKNFSFMLIAWVLLTVGPLYADNIKVAFFYHFPIGDAGWNFAHYLGQKKLENKPGLQITKLEGISPGENFSSIFKQVARQHKLVFLTSYNYIYPTLKIADHYPNTVFMNCAGNKISGNVGNYYGKIYQARYLTGLVAGAMTQSNIIGFVAAFPIPEVIRGINAFTLGVRKMNPQAEVRVAWTRHWNRAEAEKDKALQLIELGADVLAQHQNSPVVPITAQKQNIYAIGHHHDMNTFAPETHLTASIWDWGKMYEHIYQQVKEGHWKSESLWWGLEHGVVDISLISSFVPQKIKQKVLKEKKHLIRKDDIFQGPLKDQKGTIRVPRGKKLKSTEIYYMDWFVDGVVGSVRS